jgi:hypothetical protein
LKRGDLIEIEVELAADPIFKMSTLISEFLGMSESIPELAKIANVTQQLKEAGPMNRLLQHLLAGLIPLRSVAVDYCAVRMGTNEFIVHKNAMKDLEIESFPLEIVGVTEHLSYWKDIRRVLFSSGQFTMLCRVARDGVHQAWTPVKLVDLFNMVTPEFGIHINSIGEINMAQPVAQLPQPNEQKELEKALKVFANKYLLLTGNTLPDVEENTAVFIGELMSTANAKSLTGRNEAFRELSTHLKKSGLTLDPEQILELRKEARKETNFELFDKQNLPAPASFPERIPEKDHIEHRLIDTEVIAIYW